MILSTNQLHPFEKRNFSAFLSKRNGYATQELNENGMWKLGIAKKIYAMLEYLNCDKLFFIQNIKPVLVRGIYFINIPDENTAKKVFEIMTKNKKSNFGDYLHYDEENVKAKFREKVCN